MATKLITETVCFNCRHLQVYPCCSAFPAGIPESIRLGQDQHRQSVAGDQGIQFERVVLPPQPAPVEVL